MKSLYILVFSSLFPLTSWADNINGKVLEKKNMERVPLMGVNDYWAVMLFMGITSSFS